MSIKYRIESQHISTYKDDGQTRIKTSRKSRWHIWKSHDDTIDNVKDAVNDVTKTMMSNHMGGIVVVRQIVDGYSERNPTKIYQAKWGHDNIPFAQFDGVAGGYWYRQLRKEYPSLIRRVDSIGHPTK